jgi:hypothetical protein
MAIQEPPYLTYSGIIWTPYLTDMSYVGASITDFFHGCTEASTPDCYNGYIGASVHDCYNSYIRSSVADWYNGYTGSSQTKCKMATKEPTYLNGIMDIGATIHDF